MLGRTPAAVAAVVVAVMVVTLPSVVCGQYWPSDTFPLSSVDQEYWPKVEQFIYPPDPAYAHAATQFEPEIWMRYDFRCVAAWLDAFGFCFCPPFLVVARAAIGGLGRIRRQRGEFHSLVALSRRRVRCMHMGAAAAAPLGWNSFFKAPGFVAGPPWLPKAHRLLLGNLLCWSVCEGRPPGGRTMSERMAGQK